MQKKEKETGPFYALIEYQLPLEYPERNCRIRVMLSDMDGRRWLDYDDFHVTGSMLRYIITYYEKLKVQVYLDEGVKPVYERYYYDGVSR